MQYLLAFIPVALLSIMTLPKGPELVGHWSLDGTAQDQSAYAAHGQIFGDPATIAGALSGQAMDFDGDDYIEISIEGKNPAHLKSLSTGSISLWFKARSWNVDSTMLPILYYGREDGCAEAFDATNDGLVIEVGHGGIFPSENVFFTCYDQPCGLPTMCFDSNDGMGRIEPDKWYHFVAVVSESHNTGYLNGVEIEDRRYNFHSDSASLFFADALAHDKMWIGKGYWKGKELYFDGAIDDVCIYDAPLSAKEVMKMYKGKM